MQDNHSKITADLKSEIKGLGRMVENLSRNYERLNREVMELRGGANSSQQEAQNSSQGN